jgi:hypothetical protein
MKVSKGAKRKPAVQRLLTVTRGGSRASQFVSASSTANLQASEQSSALPF